MAVGETPGEDGLSLTSRDPSHAVWPLSTGGIRGGVSPVAIVWPCPLSVDAYASAGRAGRGAAAGVPVVRRRRWCSGPGTGGMSGRRGPVPEDLRAPGAVRGVRGDPCAAAGVRAGPAAGRGRDGRRGDRAGQRRRRAGSARRRPRRGCRIRRRGAGSAGSGPRAGELAVAFAALAVELGGEAVAPAAPEPRPVRAGRRSARRSRGGRACRAGRGWARWRFACAVSGGSLLAANTTSPYPDGRQAAFHASQVPPRRASETEDGMDREDEQEQGSRCTGGR